MSQPPKDWDDDDRVMAALDVAATRDLEIEFIKAYHGLLADGVEVEDAIAQALASLGL